MPHSFIIGTTTSGKSTLAKQLAEQFKKNRIEVLLLNPWKVSDFPCDWQTASPDEFCNAILVKRKCALFVDELHLLKERHDAKLDMITTMSRHCGHKAHIISQRAQHASRTMRDQCNTVYAFKISAYDADMLAKEKADEKFLLCPSLKQGQYLMHSPFHSGFYNAFE